MVLAGFKAAADDLRPGRPVLAGGGAAVLDDTAVEDILGLEETVAGGESAGLAESFVLE